MRCPKCQAEVSEWHFYCQKCRTQIQSYKHEIEKPLRGGFERAGARVLNTLAGVLIIAVLILTGRAVQWSEFFAAIRGDTNVSAESEMDSKSKRLRRAGSETDPRENLSPAATKIAEASGREKNDAVESVRAMPQRIEELPSVEDQSQSPKPRLSAALERAENAPVGTSTDSTSKSAIHPSTNDAQLGIEQIDMKNTDVTGLVAINSYASARIYINGQFSGITPRSIKLTAGDYQIRLIADGYEDWTRRVRLKAKQQVGLMASMKKKGLKQD